MSTITSGVGLISGLPINDLVDALVSIQRRPITLLENRLTVLTARRTALFQISAQILAIQNAASRFSSSDFFQTRQATSSNESAVVATASAGASVGQYTFTVRNLASTQHLISSGFATRNATPVGAGTITIEAADAYVNRSTQLASLNGGAGVRSGKIRVTDRAGGTAEIDLRTATTVDDVLKAINTQTAAQVAARVEGDHLVLEDQSGGSGNLVVADVGVGHTAADLGLLGSIAADAMIGVDLVGLSSDTALDDLNDGNGIRRLNSQKDFAVSLADGTVLEFDLSEYLNVDTPLSVLNHGTGVPAGSVKLSNRAGQSAIVDLSSAETIGDVKAAIESAGVNMTVSFKGGGLVVTDASTGSYETKIEEVDDGTTAQALGIAGTSSTGSIDGTDVLFIQTVGDVVRLINAHPDNAGKLVASISEDGLGVSLADATSGTATFEVTALNGSKAADDLGILQQGISGEIEGRRLLAGLNTVLLRSLNGGTGVNVGVIELTDRAGSTTTVDLTGAQSLADVLDRINAASVGIVASVSSSGLGIELRDTSNGTGNLIVSDVSGSTAEDLHIVFDDDAGAVSSGNLQRQYVSTNSLLSSFNGGVPAGKFRITNSAGAFAIVDLTQGNERTLQDVISEINSRGINVKARINDTGDGLLLEDNAGGTLAMKVTEEGGTTAKALNILGTAEDGETTIDGSLERRVTINGDDTLEDVLSKIRASGAAVNAAIIHDGSASRPYRLSLTSSTSGREGAMAIDPGQTGVSFQTLSEARDAAVLLGPPDAENPLLLTSASNTLTDVIPGVRLELVGTSDQPVTVTVSKAPDGIVSGLSNFVAAFNMALSTIDKLTSYDAEAEERSILTGDSTARTVRQALVNLVNKQVAGSGTQFNRLSSIGITFSSSSLKLDEDKLRRYLENDPEGVEALFTTEETGLGTLIQDEMKRLTDEETGVIPNSEEAIQASEDLLSERIAQQEKLLESYRERLLAQYAAMETVLAKLQSQQTALSALSSLTQLTSST